MIKEEKKKAIKKDNTLLTARKIETIVSAEFKKSFNRLKRIEGKFDRFIRMHDAKMHHFDKLKSVVAGEMAVYKVKMESIEDTFFTLYHNIKKNQFLYANDPEAWWNDYLELKRHYIEETKEGKEDGKDKD